MDTISSSIPIHIWGIILFIASTVGFTHNIKRKPEFKVYHLYCMVVFDLISIAAILIPFVPDKWSDYLGAFALILFPLWFLSMAVINYLYNKKEKRQQDQR